MFVEDESRWLTASPQRAATGVRTRRMLERGLSVVEAGLAASALGIYRRALTTPPVDRAFSLPRLRHHHGCAFFRCCLLDP